MCAPCQSKVYFTTSEAAAVYTHTVAVLEGKTVVHLTAGVILGQFLISLTSHREEGSCHAATIELSPWQKLDMTNQIRTLHRSYPLSWSTIMSQRA